MSQNLRWCCCEGTLNDCCEMQSCSGFVTPNQITITYGGTVQRTFSNGQVITLMTYQWQIQSNSAFTQRGNNCEGKTYDPPREFGCPTATLNYSHTWTLTQADTASGSYLDSPPVPCNGCDPTTYLCDLDVVYCATEQWAANGAPRVVNGALAPVGCCGTRADNTSVLRYLCCETCKCPRPTIVYSPATTIWATANDTLDHEVIAGCCGQTGSTDSQPNTWVFDGFGISGKCGCPDGTTWSPFANPVTASGCDPPRPVGYFSFGGLTYPSCTSIDCTGQHDGVIEVGGECWEWFCYSDSGDPFNPTVNVCSACITWVDTCSQIITVTIT